MLHSDFEEVVFPLGSVPRVSWDILLHSRVRDSRIPALEFPDDPDVFAGPLRVRLAWFHRDLPLHQVRSFLRVRGWEPEHPFVGGFLSLRYPSLGSVGVLLPDKRMLLFGSRDVSIAPRGVLPARVNLVTRLRPEL
jgi:hypothetical protein